MVGAISSEFLGPNSCSQFWISMGSVVMHFDRDWERGFGRLWMWNIKRSNSWEFRCFRANSFFLENLWNYGGL